MSSYVILGGWGVTQKGVLWFLGRNKHNQWHGASDLRSASRLTFTEALAAIGEIGQQAEIRSAEDAESLARTWGLS